MSTNSSSVPREHSIKSTAAYLPFDVHKLFPSIGAVKLVLHVRIPGEPVSWWIETCFYTLWFKYFGPGDWRNTIPFVKTKNT